MGAIYLDGNCLNLSNFCVRIVEESAIRFVVIANEDGFNCLGTEGIAFRRVVEFDVGDAEEGQEVTVVCFFAVGFEERCCEGVCVSFYRMVIA